jgi:glycosyltransferase involved in cell wall biosynthesis
MKVAQVSPLYESVPPVAYGGTERIVAYLTDELVSQGHDVTLFASGDSRTRGKLVPIVPKSLRLGNDLNADLYNVLQVQEVLTWHERFDIIHYHTDFLHFPSSNLKRLPRVTTLHGRLDIGNLDQLYTTFPREPLISISYKQREPLVAANWVGNVYHGLPEHLYSPGQGKGNYAAFLGRISPEKGLEAAIAITEQAGIPLQVAAKIDPADRQYFENEIKHLLKKPHVEFIGEISDSQKGTFLGEALFTIFPVNWPEPFGLVMIESLACGTPVIAFNRGSVPEVIVDGLTGYIVGTIGEAVDAINKISLIDRRRCREMFLKKFTAARMASDYCKLYEELIRDPSTWRNDNIQLNGGVQTNLAIDMD